MKKLRYNRWQPLAWFGLSLRVPEDWNPGKIIGDAKSGSVRLDDARIVRVELEWKEAAGDANVSGIVDRYVEGLAKNAQKKSGSLNVERGLKVLGGGPPDFDASEYFRWDAAHQVHTFAGHSGTSDRLIFVRVMTHPEEDAHELLAQLFGSLSDAAPDGPQPWALYGLSFETPPGYALEEYDLRSGHIRVTFQSGTTQLRIDRLSLAQMMLGEQSLSDWYAGFFRKDLRYIDATTSNAPEGESTIVVSGAPRPRLKSLLQPLPFWNASPRRHLTGKVWVSDEENKIFAVQSFHKTPSDAPDLDPICRAIAAVEDAT